jgi:hypothetical protein
VSTTRIQSTKNYEIFTRSSENRPLCMKKHRKLEESMEQYGFLRSFPIVVVRNDKGHLVIKDGQHRLAIAQSKGLTVFYAVEEVDFDVAVINSTAKTWVLADYAQKHAANGHKQYQEGIDFATQHGLPLGTAFALLAGTTTYGNIERTFVDGTFKIKDREWADAVAGIYAAITRLAPNLGSARFVEACMSVCRVKGFDSKRLLHCAGRCREKLVPYATKDAYLDLLQEVYNFGQQKLVGLKVEAQMAMKRRNAVRTTESQ